MKKKIIALILAAFLLLSLTACACKNDPVHEDAIFEMQKTIDSLNEEIEELQVQVADLQMKLEDQDTNDAIEETLERRSGTLAASTEAVIFSMDWQNSMKENGVPSLLSCVEITDAAYICSPTNSLTLTFYTVNDSELYGVSFEMNGGTADDKAYFAEYIHGLISATSEDGSSAVKLWNSLCISAINKNVEYTAEASSDVMKASWGYTGNDYAFFAAKAAD